MAIPGVSQQQHYDAREQNTVDYGGSECPASERNAYVSFTWRARNETVPRPRTEAHVSHRRRQGGPLLGM